MMKMFELICTIIIDVKSHERIINTKAIFCLYIFRINIVILLVSLNCVNRLLH